MRTHVSAGVYFEELDFSLYAPRLSKTVPAIIGVFEKGPTTPTLITTARQQIDKFGTPKLGSYSAYAGLSYLEFGSQLWIKRLVGPKAKKASTEISMGSVVLNENIGSPDGSSYIITGSLNKTAIPGTITMALGDHNIADDGNGNLYGSGVIAYPQFIDYDSGTYNFMFETGPANNSRVRIRYNYKEFEITGLQLENGDGTKKAFTGTLPHSQLKPKTLVITDGVETFVDNGLGVLESSNGSGVDGTINYKTGNWSVSFVSAPLITAKVVATQYVYTTFLDKFVGYVDNNRKAWIGSVNEQVLPGSVSFYWETNTSVDDENVGSGDGNKKTFEGVLTHGNVGKVVFTDGVETFTEDGFSGILIGSNGGSGTVNYSTGKYSITFKVPVLTGVNNVKVNYDYYTPNTNTANQVYDGNKDGLLIGNIVICDNEIDYDTGDFKVALMKAPDTKDADGNNVVYTATYTSKFMDIVEYGDGIVKSFNETVMGAPLTKGSVDIYVESTLTLKDNGEGLLVSVGATNNGNGIINYNTGELVINFANAPANQALITAQFLRKYGDAVAVSEGEWANNTKFTVYKDRYLGYGIKVWDPTQYTTQTPIENWPQMVFDNVEDTNYVSIKLASSYFTIEPIVNEENVSPILGIIYTLTGGKADLEGIRSVDAINGIEQFADPEGFDINLCLCPDYAGNPEVSQKIIQMCETRYDCFGLIDPPKGLTPQQVIDWSNGDGQWSSLNAYNSSFASLYYPWIKIYDVFNKRPVWVPPSVKMIGVYAYSDMVAEPWMAPAGLNRGRLFNTLATERPLTIGERDAMYGTQNSVNPIVDFKGDGIVAWGQRTLQRKPSALDRVNVRRLMIHISKVLATAVKYIVFEPNDPITWTSYRLLVQPFLDDVKSRRGLYDFGIRCDSSTNTPYHIDNNEMVAEIWLQPVKAAEKVITRFILTPTGVSLGEIIIDN